MSNSFGENIQEMLNTVIVSLMPVPLNDTQPVPVPVPCVTLTSTSVGNRADDTQMNPMTTTMPMPKSSLEMLEQVKESQRCERLCMYPRAAAWKATKAIWAQTQSQLISSNASGSAPATSKRRFKRVSRQKKKADSAQGQGSNAKKENNWKCGICPLTFSSLSKLNNHRCKHHLKEVRGFYGCPNCDQLFKEGSKLLEHYNDHL